MLGAYTEVEIFKLQGIFFKSWRTGNICKLGFPTVLYFPYLAEMGKVSRLPPVPQISTSIESLQQKLLQT